MSSTKRHIALGMLIVTIVISAVTIPRIIDAWGARGDAVWGFEGFGILAALVFAGSGTLLASRRPKNPVGWLFAATGLAFAVQTAAEQYAGIPLIHGHDGGANYQISWFTSWAWIIFDALIAFAVLLFPTGELPGPRWHIPARLMIAGFALGAVGFAFSPGQLTNFPEHITNRYAVPPGQLARILEIGMLGLVLSMATAAAAVVSRFRSSRGVQRQQMKLFALAATVMGGTFLLLPLSELELGLGGVPADVLEVVSVLATMSIPIAMTIAILRYRLYDIDVIINRTLVYGLLSATLIASYLLIVVALSRLLDPITRDSDIAVAASTLAVAALFRPLRRRIQQFIDRRFYRSRYNAAKALHDFVGRLRDEVDIGVVERDVLGVVRTTVQPVHASLWMNSRESL